MNIAEKLKRLLKFYRIPMYVCGVEILNPNHVCSYRTLVSGTICIMYYICVVNTIFTWPLISILEMLSACGIAVSVS
jgi:hypothetical protein